MKKSFILSLLISLQAGASTFVGNGGNAGDVELQVARKEIREVLKLIQTNHDSKDMKLCVCYPDLEGHPICETLKKLNSAQIEFCSQYLKEHGPELSRALEKAEISWTATDIEVEDQSSLRAADAVTDFNRQKITLTQKRFLSLNDYERMFLLTHESGHLLKFQNQPIQDRQTLGPFTSSEGGREFLNAIAAAVVMEGLDTQVLTKYRSTLKRSRKYQDWWIDALATSFNSSEGTFLVSKKQGSTFGLRYQLTDHVGAGVEYRSGRGHQNFLTSIKSEEKLQSFALKGSYSFFPFGDPLSYWGQSHFVLAGGIDFLRSQYTLSDSTLETSVENSSSALVADISYYLPLQSGFWITVRAGYLGHQYKYEIPYRTLEIKPHTFSSFGVSYGF